MCYIIYRDIIKREVSILLGAEAIVTLISTLGFPIATSVALFWLILQTNDRYNETIEQLRGTRKMQNEELKKQLGQYCREFRTHVVRVTLEDMGKVIGIKSRTLSNFENGRSGNVAFLSAYMKICDSQEMKTRFIIGLSDILDSHEFTPEVANNG
jgi:DNA-binding XRE family transcriptional regulator